MYNRTVMVDLDDTLSFTTNRNFDNAHCDQGVVEKLRELKAMGWTIVIQTARGQLSCNGDHLAADLKYRKSVETWLRNHNVPYHELTFNKRLAQLYIDDKAMTPWDFKETIFSEEHGLSGADVIRIGDRIHKTHHNAKNEAAWYDMAERVVKVPGERVLCGSTLTMQYIENDSLYDWAKLKPILMTFKSIPIICSDWESYLNRLIDHAKLAGLDCSKIEQLGLKFSKIANENKSFCHGDFSIDNILWYKNEPVLIDPIDMSDSYSSWVLDYSKLIQSIYRTESNHKYESTLLPGDFVDFLIMSHWLRLIKYVSGELKSTAIGKVNEYIDIR